MAGDMTIAIIMPIYNQAQYLRTCLDSLVAQTDGDPMRVASRDDVERAVEEIIRLDRDDDAYFAKLAAPSFTPRRPGSQVLHLDAPRQDAEADSWEGLSEAPIAVS